MSEYQENIVLRYLRIPEVSVIFFSFLLHLAWEVFQTPLFRWRVDSVNQYVLCKFACTSADVAISLGAYWLVSAIFRNRRWYLLHKRMPVVLFIVAGLAALAFSEYRNLYITHAWTYVEGMPVILGIGLLPLLQWLLLPLVIILLLQAIAGRQK